jgi:hypothetical protein
MAGKLLDSVNNNLKLLKFMGDMSGEGYGTELSK